jgi:hypothetical protein
MEINFLNNTRKCPFCQTEYSLSNIERKYLKGGIEQVKVLQLLIEKLKRIEHRRKPQTSWSDMNEWRRHSAWDEAEYYNMAMREAKLAQLKMQQELHCLEDA